MNRDEKLKFRKEVGSRIKLEREKFFDHCTKEKKDEILKKRQRKRSYDGLSQAEFAEELGIGEDKLYNLETGRGELNTEYLFTISEVCGCDIGYLLGECKNRTYIATDISKETGLSEEAIEVLRRHLFFTAPTPYYDELSIIFLRLVNHIIESFTFPTDPQKENGFPINLIVDYIVSIIRWEDYEKHHAEEGKALFDKAVERMMEQEPLFEKEIAEYVVERVQPSWLNDYEWLQYGDYYNYLEFLRKEKRYKRIDIQDAFSKFLTSDFVEGDIINK
jgi:transcriptional regulator with XRE-family HTH domain